jgi:hypothetical protein
MHGKNYLRQKYWHFMEENYFDMRILNYLTKKNNNIFLSFFENPHVKIYQEDVTSLDLGINILFIFQLTILYQKSNFIVTIRNFMYMALDNMEITRLLEFMGHWCLRGLSLDNTFTHEWYYFKTLMIKTYLIRNDLGDKTALSQYINYLQDRQDSEVIIMTYFKQLYKDVPLFSYLSQLYQTYYRRKHAMQLEENLPTLNGNPSPINGDPPSLNGNLSGQPDGKIPQQGENFSEEFQFISQLSNNDIIDMLKIMRRDSIWEEIMNDYGVWLPSQHWGSYLYNLGLLTLLDEEIVGADLLKKIMLYWIEAAHSGSVEAFSVLAEYFYHLGNIDDFETVVEKCRETTDKTITFPHYFVCPFQPEIIPYIENNYDYCFNNLDKIEIFTKICDKAEKNDIKAMIILAIHYGKTDIRRSHYYISKIINSDNKLWFLAGAIILEDIFMETKNFELSHPIIFYEDYILALIYLKRFFDGIVAYFKNSSKDENLLETKERIPPKKEIKEEFMKIHQKYLPDYNEFIKTKSIKINFRPANNIRTCVFTSSVENYTIDENILCFYPPHIKIQGEPMCRMKTSNSSYLNYFYVLLLPIHKNSRKAIKIVRLLENSSSLFHEAWKIMNKNPQLMDKLYPIILSYYWLMRDYQKVTDYFRNLIIESKFMFHHADIYCYFLYSYLNEEKIQPSRKDINDVNYLYKIFHIIKKALGNKFLKQCSLLFIKFYANMKHPNLISIMNEYFQENEKRFIKFITQDKIGKYSKDEIPLAHIYYLLKHKKAKNLVNYINDYLDKNFFFITALKFYHILDDHHKESVNEYLRIYYTIKQLSHTMEIPGEINKCDICTDKGIMIGFLCNHSVCCSCYVKLLTNNMMTCPFCRNQIQGLELNKK